MVEEQRLTSQTEITRILSDPEAITARDLSILEDLTKEFPYCQSFHYAYTSALRRFQPQQYEHYVQKAAFYSPEREVLYKYIHQPERFKYVLQAPGVDQILVDEPVAEIDTSSDSLPLASTELEDAVENLSVDESDEEIIEPMQSDTESPDLPELELSSEDPESEPATERSLENVSEEASVSEDDFSSSNFTALELEDDQEEDDEAIELHNSSPEIESVVPEELPLPIPVSIENAYYSVADEIETVIPEVESPFGEKETEGHPAINAVEEEASPEIASEQEEIVAAPANDPAEDRRIVGSIASSDYFVFDRSAVDPLKSPAIEENQEPDPAEVQEVNDLAKYHDDTLPYTFLWWLHKTRKEYAATYQPYVIKAPAFGVQKAGNAELNQQIIENIFHIQPELNTFPPNVLASPPVETKKKEDEIIEKFIKEEPQIRPPQLTQLDTENKARKSSEDNLDLVTETLARIYTDQMLYHKAIDIYKKLSLKFPEKKLYFAGQIEELEKKIH
ncbi:hypothetical protein [Pedobacter sp. SYSU D00535]|uniref:hypothetical protein n=1 Tax=Pedobacter sp. SYSU D00535 TaxID=2810308 RepID=UPI001A966798|nr:hypothetical protein [Pedobacter sp. SYSU D00535]